MSVKLVVFDMAGTTVKDRNYVGVAFQTAMKTYGYDVAVEEVNPIMGYQKPLAISMMLANHEPDQSKITEVLIHQIHDVFVKEMIQFYTTSDDIYPLPHVEETFAELRSNGVKIGLNTGFSRDIADVIIGRLGWADKIDMLVASDEVPNGRPYPDMINKMKASLGIGPNDEVAKVGDTEVDVNEGINAGCKYVIAVTTGAFTRSELAPYQPTHIIDDMAEILEILSVEHATR